MKCILYISYDGMTDPLGQSQVIPYLKALSKHGYQFTILSFEKKEKFIANKNKIDEDLKASGIKWEPLSFTTKPPVVAKMYDVYRMFKTAEALHKEFRYDLVHCRSYISASVGLKLKRRTGIKFLFDMRGFWADEKKDAGAWNLANPLFRRVYAYYKKKESQYVSEADAIISLTDAGKKEMLTWPAYNPKAHIHVIPCCADMNLFSKTNYTDKVNGRKLLGLPEKDLVISYLGTLGSWYMIDEMMQLFNVIHKTYPKSYFLFISNSKPEMVLAAAKEFDIDETFIKIVTVSRQDVPVYTKASDINISFIKPVYSKISSSPTKLGEVLVMGIPVIVNAGVGDIEEQVLNANAGVVLKNFSDEEFERAVKSIPMLLEKRPEDIRNGVANTFDLAKGVEKYLAVYQQILK